MISIKEGRAIQLEIEEKYGVHIHIHDQCGHGVWFGLDEENDDVKEYILSRLRDEGADYQISESGLVIGTK